MLNNENILRVNEIDESFIPHVKIQNAIETIEKSIFLSKNSREPVNVFMTGRGGVGKTTASNHIVSGRRHIVIKEEDREITTIPAFYTSIPDPATPKGVASQMLIAMKQPKPDSGTAMQITQRLKHLLIECKTEVIILDELQHLLKKDSQKTGEVKNWIKSIINDTRIPLVIVGTPECENIIDTHDDHGQLARRFTTRIKLTNLNHQPGKKSSEFSKFTGGLSLLLNKKANIEIDIDYRAASEMLALYAATNGNPSDTVNLFKNACIVALEHKQAKVTKKDFIVAYDNLYLPNSMMKSGNPFEMKTTQLHTSINSHYRSVS